MKIKKKLAALFLLLLGAIGAITTAQAAGVAVGGTWSVNKSFGMNDLAYAPNSDYFRSLGGMLFIHEESWGATGNKSAVIQNWPNLSNVIYESGGPQCVGAAKERIQEWGGGKLKGVCVNFLHRNSDGSIHQAGIDLAREMVRDGHAEWCAPVESPNGSQYDVDNAKWNDDFYQPYRDVAEAGGAVCLDTPPNLYFSSQNYRNFAYDQLLWAKQKGLKTVVIVSPNGLSDYFDGAQKIRNDLTERGLFPDFWAVELYSPKNKKDTDPDVTNHPIGSEDNNQHQLGVALNVFLHPQIGAPINKTIWIKSTANNQFVCADLGLGADRPLAANRTAVGGWEKFYVQDAGGGKISLRANANSKYVVADYPATPSPLEADRDGVGDWEQFTWVHNPDGTVSLIANANGMYVVAEGGPDWRLNANRNAIDGPWEKFTWGQTDY